MIEAIINADHTYCAFCKKKLSLIDEIESINKHWECSCEEWIAYNNPQAPQDKSEK